MVFDWDCQKNSNIYFLVYFFILRFFIIVSSWYKFIKLKRAVLYLRRISRKNVFKHRQKNNNSCTVRHFRSIVIILSIVQKIGNFNLMKILRIESYGSISWWNKWSQILQRNEKKLTGIWKNYHRFFGIFGAARFQSKDQDSSFSYSKVLLEKNGVAWALFERLHLRICGEIWARRHRFIF